MEQKYTYTCFEEGNPRYERNDACYGTVTGRNASGCYLTLDNEESAFAYRFSNLLPGTKVICTVRRTGRAEEYRRTLVDIDSVCYAA